MKFAPTAVVYRPVPPECRLLETFEETKKNLVFNCFPRVFVVACADGIVAKATKREVIVYTELPTMTVFIRYYGLESCHVERGQKITERDIIGSPGQKLVFSIQHLPDHTVVEPEFFVEDSCY